MVGGKIDKEPWSLTRSLALVPSPARTRGLPPLPAPHRFDSPHEPARQHSAAQAPPDVCLHGQDQRRLAGSLPGRPPLRARRRPSNAYAEDANSEAEPTTSCTAPLSPEDDEARADG
jgi:hypothetical protein